MKKAMDRVLIDPETPSGKAVVKGICISAYVIVELLGSGLTEADVRYQCPAVKRENGKAALLYAAKCLRKEGI